jgi:hypothetical protein
MFSAINNKPEHTMNDHEIRTELEAARNILRSLRAATDRTEQAVRISQVIDDIETITEHGWSEPFRARYAEHVACNMTRWEIRV